jgi:hypothetical protein
MSEKPITQRIKDRLAAYTAMLRDIDNQLERLDRMEMTMASPPGPDLTGMPRGSGTPSDRTGMMVERKMELEEQIDRLKAEEKKERNAIEGLILQLSSGCATSTGLTGRAPAASCSVIGGTTSTEWTPTRTGHTRSTAAPCSTSPPCWTSWSPCLSCGSKTQ